MKIVPRKRTKWLDKDESKQKSNFRMKIRQQTKKRKLDEDDERKRAEATKKMEKGAK